MLCYVTTARWALEEVGHGIIVILHRGGPRWEPETGRYDGVYQLLAKALATV
jgi:hypothetical protein